MRVKGQEVTENIYALLSAKGWWRRYVASPIPYDRPYFTALLHLRDAVHNAQPVRLRDFSNSAMGAPGSDLSSMQVLLHMSRSAAQCAQVFGAHVQQHIAEAVLALPLHGT